VEESLNDGDCWVEYEELVDRANTLLVMDVLDSRERIEKSLDALIEDGSLSCTSWGGRFLVAKPEIRRMEEDLAATLANGKRANPHFDGEDDLQALISHVAPQLNEGQRAAVLTVLENSISLISGGAGSGKTFTVSAVTDIFEEHDLRVVLAAPTGKAAKRLEQVVGHSASTIHRLLGFNGKTYVRGPEDLIDADVIIIDEVSMVDIPLAWHLFRTIDLERTAVFSWETITSCPPWGPGTCFATSHSHGPSPWCCWTRSFARRACSRKTA